MEQKEYTFKTNLNCGGCVSKVKSELDNTKGIITWNVDTAHTDKLLTICAEGIDSSEIMKMITNKGFKIEPYLLP